MKLPVNISLVFGFNNFLHQQIPLPSTNYRSSVGEVKRASHHRGESIGMVQYVKGLLIKHHKLQTYQDILKECIENGTTGYLIMPNITWLLCLYDKNYVDYSNNKKFMEHQLNISYLGKGNYKISKEIQVFREMIVEVLKFEIEAGDFCLETYHRLTKLNWKTQDVVDFYQFDNESNSFKKVDGK